MLGTLFFLVFFGMGLLFCVWIGREFFQVLATYGWRQAGCVILESKVVDDGRRQAPYRVQLRYAYDWQGRHYTSERAFPTEARFSDYSEADQKTRRFPPDTKAVCYVNPDAPDEALLLRRSRWFGLSILFPLVFVGIGAVGMLAMWWNPAGRNQAHTPIRVRPISSTPSASALAGFRFRAIFFGIFLLAGLGIFYALSVRIVLAVWSAQSWREVPCTILSSRLQAHQGDDSTTYRVDILYRYEVDGRSYQSSRYHFMLGSSSGREGKNQIVRRHPPGARTVCYVDPNDASEAVLQRGFTAEMWFGLIPLAFVFAGLGGLLHAWRQRRAGVPGTESVPPAPAGSSAMRAVPARTAAAGGASSLSWEDADPAESRLLKPAASRWVTVIVLGIFAILWNGFLFFTSHVGSGPGRLLMGLFMIPFYLVGLGLAGVVLYQVLGLFNPKVELMIKPGVPVLGAGLEVSWRLDGRTQVLRSLQVYLEAREEATSRQGTRTVTDRKAFLKIEITAAGGPPISPEGQGRVVLPADAVPSFRSTNNRIVWTIHVGGEIARWPDLKEEFEIQVRPPAVLSAA